MLDNFKPDTYDYEYCPVCDTYLSSNEGLVPTCHKCYPRVKPTKKELKARKAAMEQALIEAKRLVYGNKINK